MLTLHRSLSLTACYLVLHPAFTYAPAFCVQYLYECSTGETEERNYAETSRQSKALHVLMERFYITDK